MKNIYNLPIAHDTIKLAQKSANIEGDVEMKLDAIVVGARLVGLVAAAEIADAGKNMLLLDQEPAASLGGQAWWSFGGCLFSWKVAGRAVACRGGSTSAL